MINLRKALSGALALVIPVLSLACASAKPLKTISIPTTPAQLTTHSASKHSNDRAGLPCVVFGGLSDCPAEPPAGRVRVGFATSRTPRP